MQETNNTNQSPNFTILCCGKVHPETKSSSNDRFNPKSTLNMLYQAACTSSKEDAKRDWKKFVKEVDDKCPTIEQIKGMINHLDDRKQWAPLHYAVDANNIFVFKKLTGTEERFQCDININGGHSENILHIAAQSKNIWNHKQSSKSGETASKESMTTKTGDVQPSTGEKKLPDIIKAIFGSNVNVNDADNDHRTPLHLAVQANHLEFAEALIAREANLMATTKFNENVLHFALMPNSATSKELHKMVEFILPEDKRHQKKEEGRTLIDMPTLDNQTPLAYALCHPAVTEGLIKRLLNEIQEMDEKQLFVAFAMMARSRVYLNEPFTHLSPLVDWIKQRHYSKEILHQLSHIICQKNNFPLLNWFHKRMMQDDGYLHTKNDKNENILHICAKRQIHDAVFNEVWKYLTKESDNYRDLLTGLDDEGNSPLEVAAHYNNRYVCHKLLEKISEVSSRVSAAHAASVAGHLDILKEVLDCPRKSGTEEDILKSVNQNGYTCLHLAAMHGHKTIVDFLLTEQKMEVDIMNNRRQTPLHLACQDGRETVVETLLKAKASTTLRNAEVYNSLEVAIINRQKPVVQQLLKHSAWRDMMRNAQPIEKTEAFDTPMRKLIRFMPDVAVWLIDNKLTKTVGGPGQTVHKTIYDYEFYEDTNTVKKWYSQDAKAIPKPRTCADLWNKRGIEAIHTWWFCGLNGLGCGCCSKTKKDEYEDWYTNDAYTLVRNHPLFIASQQRHYPPLIEHFYHTHLRQTKLRSFGLVFFIISLLLYMSYLCLFTAAVFVGKHPKYFYDKADVNWTMDLSTCKYVSNYFANNPDVASEALETNIHRILKWILYVGLSIFIAKNVIIIVTLFPRVFRLSTSYVEISALLLSYVYILDWGRWQRDVVFRCPVQYQLGAMGLLLGYLNFLAYLRTSPVLDIGVYVAMLQVISGKFLRFLPVLLVIICGFGFTFWMLLQYQDVYRTPMEALMRTGIMLFDLGYDDRLYGGNEEDQGYYKLVYVVFMLTAIVCSIFVINLLIGLAVGEIPSLLTQGTLWRHIVLYDLLSDYEILRIRLILLFDYLSGNRFCGRPIPWFRPRPYFVLENDESVHPMGKLGDMWKYTEKHFFFEQIQDTVMQPTKHTVSE